MEEQAQQKCSEDLGERVILRSLATKAKARRVARTRIENNVAAAMGDCDQRAAEEEEVARWHGELGREIVRAGLRATEAGLTFNP